jgi:hypothetical protein
MNQFIARGSYHVPVLGGFNVGASYRYYSGQALSRTAVFRLAQGNTTVRVEPRGALPTEAISQADLRASGATFGQPSHWSTPRTVLVSGSLSF